MKNNIDHLTQSRKFITCLLLMALTLVDLGTDIFIPSLPQMAKFFGVDEELAKLAISLNLLGISISALIYGPISDGWGRRKTVILGTSIFLVGTILSTFSPSIEIFLFSRFVTGLGGGAACVVALAGVSDLYSEQEKPRVLAVTGMILAITPGVAPLLGGYLAYFVGWRGVFATVSVIGIGILYLLYKSFPETNKRKHSVNLISSLQQYSQLLLNFNYLAYILIFSLGCSIIWIECSELPFVFTETYNLAEQHYGYYTVAGISCYVLCMMLNRYLLKFMKINSIINAGILLMVVGFCSLYALSYAIELNVILIRIVLFISTMGTAFILSNSLSRAMSAAGENSGMGSALVGPMEMLIGAGMVTLVAEFYDASIRPYAITGIVMSFVTLLVFQAVRRKQNAAITQT